MVIYLFSLLLLFTIFWMGFFVIIFLFLLFSTLKNPIHFTLLKIIIFIIYFQYFLGLISTSKNLIFYYLYHKSNDFWKLFY